MPTVGEEPKDETRDAVSMTTAQGITVSLIGIGIDKEGEKLARQIAELGDGKFYLVRDIENLDRVILEDYYSL